MIDRKHIDSYINQAGGPTAGSPTEPAVSGELRNTIEIAAVKEFISKMIEFNHFNGYDLRFIEQRLCDFIASR